MVVMEGRRGKWIARSRAEQSGERGGRWGGPRGGGEGDKADM